MVRSIVRISGGTGGGTGGTQGPPGKNAPNVIARYSSDASSWHQTYTSNDKYIRFSYNNGVSWDSAIDFKGPIGPAGQIGEQGPSAPQTVALYSDNGTDWDDVPTDSTQYARFSYDGEITWSYPIKIKGEKGENGTGTGSGITKISSIVRQNSYITQVSMEDNKTYHFTRNSDNLITGVSLI